MMRKQSIAVACLCASSLLARAHLAHAEGSAELGTLQGVDSSTTLFVEVLDPNESIHWNGPFLAVVVTFPDGATTAVLLNGNSIDASQVGTYRIDLPQPGRIDPGTAWDIAVRIDDGEALPGRLFARKWALTADDPTADGALSASFYAAVPVGGDGGVVELRFDGMSSDDGGGEPRYALTASATGLDGDNAGRSVPGGQAAAPEGELGLYLNPPTSASYSVPAPAISSFTFRGGAQACSAVVPGQPGGSFLFASNTQGNYQIVCDLDQDGAFDLTDNDDLLLLGSADTGVNQVPWDGTDRDGDPVAAGTYQCQARVTVGEVHFLADDVETSFQGLRTFAVAGDGTPTALAMYWNDRLVQENAVTMPDGAVGLETSGPAGLGAGDPGAAASANVNARAWGDFGTGGKGDGALLDTFTWIDDSVSGAIEITATEATADTDGDGIDDITELCVLGTEPDDADTDDDGVADGDEDTADTDGDGLIDSLDPDSDNDGILDGTESGLAEPHADTDVSRGNFVPDADDSTTTNPRSPHSDLDGSNPEAVDDGAEDPNHNGRIDAGEMDPNESADDILLGEPLPDRDGDGLTDTEEQLFGTSDSDADSDDDGLLDGSEPNWNLDTDGDGIVNVFDPDADNDGLFDGTEAGVSGTPPDTDRSRATFVSDADPSTTTSPLAADSDHGGVDDAAEDPNHDGRIDAGELDPGDGADDVVLPADLDDDGLSDAEEAIAGTDPDDADMDDDGVLDGAEVHWNQDTDGDGLRNVEDPDSDGDGLFDGTEQGVTAPHADTDARRKSFIADADPTTTTRPLDADTDDGGVRDGAEDPDHDGSADVDAGELDPNDGADDAPPTDTDADGLTDVEEMTFGSDPMDADTDDDGAVDGAEPSWSADTDRDSLIDVLDADADDDGLFDGMELGVDDTRRSPDTDVSAGVYVADADASTSTSPVSPDTDRGGARDGAEDPNHDGAIDGGELDPNDPADDTPPPPDQDGDGLSDAEEAFEGTDGADADSDDDGVLDGDEQNWNQDTDGDGQINANDADSDGDGLFDGTERGVVDASPDTDASAGSFIADADPSTTTSALDADSDDGGVVDGLEDLDENGRVDDREIDPNDGADDQYLDQDQDTIIDTDEGTDDADGDGTPNHLDPDADGDIISDEDEAGDIDRTTAPVDTDGDGTPDFLDDDTDGDGVSDADEAGDDVIQTVPVDNDGDGTADFRDTDSDNDGTPDGEDPCRIDENDACVAPDDRDGDGIPDGADNCPDRPNQGQLDRDGDGIGNACDADADGDGWNDDLTVGGGGCAAGGEGSAGAGLLVLLALGLAVRRRRRHPLALAGAALALGMIALAPGAHAQEAQDGDFPAERFHLAADGDGVLSAEWAAVPAHLSWDVALLFGLQNEPLVVYREMDGERERAGALVARRISASLVGSLALWNRVSLGLELPVILSQKGDALDGTLMPDLGSAGVGDIRVAPKVQLLHAARSGVDLAVIPALTLPTGSAEDFRGEDGVTFAPEVAVSRAVGAWRLASNLGYRMRKNTELADLDVIDEVFLRLGAGYRFAERGGAPVEIDLGLSAATAAARPLDSYNQNHMELLAGVGYDMPGPFEATLGGGLGLGQGFGTPDWRVLLAVRAGGRANPDRDSDGDGQLDEADGCPKEAEDKDGFEDEDGCPDLDNDGDGVADADDGAPNEAEDKDGFEDEDGVPDKDNDGDGVADDEDACASEAENQNGYQDEDGCPDTLPDSDSDGLSDRVDECPDQAEDVDGFQDQDGCPDPDNDGDGVVDASDRCVGEVGPVENRGCPDTDRDGDGVVDRLDNCPDEAGTARNQGCKRRQRVRLSSTRIEILDRVFFQSNRAKIQRRSLALLRNVAQVLSAHPEIARVQVEGHTDDRGDDAYNLELSQRRAEAVVEYLVQQGVPRERLIAKGYGETKPLEDNKTRRGRANNRRVEFNIVEEPPQASAPPPAPAAGAEAGSDQAGAGVEGQAGDAATGTQAGDAATGTQAGSGQTGADQTGGNTQ